MDEHATSSTTAKGPTVANKGAVDAAARVLVVDDEAQVRDSVARILRGRGYDVETATDGASALATIATRACDVIVSDISMPAMDGIALMRSVREVDLDTPIILLTGSPSLETAKNAIELGAFRYLTKPVNKDELETAVARATVARRVALLKRDALAAAGGDSAAAGDIAGLQVSFDRALQKLWMAYQPIVRASDGTVFGYEALMRSDEPALPHPGAMLDAAERLRRVLDLGRVVRARSVPAMVDAPIDHVFFVNLHPADLLDDDLLLRDAPLSAHAHRIVLEITERATISNMNEVRLRLGRLREMGFRFAVDDLGAGYAGLTSFATLEPDIVKLDMTLIRDVDSNQTKQRVVRSMVGLCREIGTTVVAEGIETPSERDTIVSLGCDLVQGYFVAKPGRPFPSVHW